MPAESSPSIGMCFASLGVFLKMNAARPARAQACNLTYPLPHAIHREILARSRPRHYQLARHRVRRIRGSARSRAARDDADLSATRVGRAGPARNLAVATAIARAKRSPRRVWMACRSQRSALPTNAKRRSSGTAVPAQPVCNAIVWQDRRTADICDRLKSEGLEALFTGRTGLVLDAYFSGTKLRWVLDHVPNARREAQAGHLCFGTVDSWLIWNLTAGRAHVTDASNASRTLLYNIHTGDWDDKLLGLMSVPRSVLPRVVGSSGPVAETEPTLVRCPDPGGGYRRRPTGRTVRPALRGARHGQEYLWHRLLHVNAHR